MLITESHKAAQREAHANMPSYGGMGHTYAPLARESSQWGELSILDYGCGKGSLKQRLGPQYSVAEYDPGIEGKDIQPEPADVVFCMNVLEHVEPECLDAVLADLRRVTKQAAVVLVHLVPAIKFLADGRNTHLTVEGADWWRSRLEGAGFTIASCEHNEQSCRMVCS